MRFKCIKELYVDSYDEDGFWNGGDYIIIPVNSIWILDKSNTRIAGGNDTFRLELETSENKYQWLEISENTLIEHFEILN